MGRSYRERVTTQVHEACPMFPNVIMDLVLEMALGKTAYHVCAPDAVQMAEFDFLYTERKSASAELKTLSKSDKVLGSFGGIEFSLNQVRKEFASKFDAISTPSLVGKDGQAVLDETIRKSRELSADQIELDPEFHSEIVTEIQNLVKKLKHPNKVVAKLHKLLIFSADGFSDTHIDKWPRQNNDKPVLFNAFVSLRNGFLGRSLEVGGECVLDWEDNVITVFNPHEVPYRVSQTYSDYSGFFLVFEVFDLGIPEPGACILTPVEAFAKAIAMGFNKVGLEAREDYPNKFTRRLKAHELQGTDKMFADHARASGAKRIQVCRLYFDDKHTFGSEVLNLLKIHFPANYRYVSHEKEDPDDLLRIRMREKQKLIGEVENEGDSEHSDDSEDDDEEEEKAAKEKVEEAKRDRKSLKRSRIQLGEEEEEEEEKAKAGEEAKRKEKETKGQQQQQQAKEQEKSPTTPDSNPPLPPRLVRPHVTDDDEIAPRLDEKGAMRAMKDECRLGDMLYLASEEPTGPAYEEGAIECLLAVIAHF